MSESNVNSVLSSNRLIVRGFLGAILVLYMQNRLTKLYTKSHELALQIGQLERERTLQQLEINKLSSLENLSVFAEGAELGLNGVPTKVRVTGAP